MNAHRDIKRQQLREVTFSDLTPQEENQLHTFDRYIADDEAEQIFCVGGKEITAKLLAEALHNLSDEKRETVNFEAVTARYVDVRLERKKEVLDSYHDVIKQTDPAKQGAATTPPKKTKGAERKKSSEISL